MTITNMILLSNIQVVISRPDTRRPDSGEEAEVRGHTQAEGGQVR